MADSPEAATAVVRRGDLIVWTSLTPHFTFPARNLPCERLSANDLPMDHRIDVQPLAPIATPTGNVSETAAVMESPDYAEIRAYFWLYPGGSLMSDHSRAVLYSLARMMRPQLIAEIGTLYAGTTEVFARAL